MSYKKRFGDRKDAALVRDIDGMHYVMPLLFPGRTANEAFISEMIDLSKLNDFLERKNAEGSDFRYTFFHLMVTAMLRVITQRPLLNRFIKNGSLFHRDEISASFLVKKRLPIPRRGAGYRPRRTFRQPRLNSRNYQKTDSAEPLGGTGPLKRRYGCARFPLSPLPFEIHPAGSGVA